MGGVPSVCYVCNQGPAIFFENSLFSHATNMLRDFTGAEMLFSVFVRTISVVQNDQGEFHPKIAERTPGIL